MQDSRITPLLRKLGEKDNSLDTPVMDRIYRELRRLAAASLRNERPGHTLQPSALVNEAYLRLSTTEGWSSRGHFFSAAARLMRQILIDYARARRADKRGGGVVCSGIPDEIGTLPYDPAEILRIHTALERLEALSERQARVVEMRFFAGLSVEETAEALDVSPKTVKRDWAVARAWLQRELAAP